MIWIECRICVKHVHPFKLSKMFVNVSYYTQAVLRSGIADSLLQYNRPQYPTGVTERTIVDYTQLVNQQILTFRLLNKIKMFGFQTTLNTEMKLCKAAYCSHREPYERKPL